MEKLRSPQLKKKKWSSLYDVPWPKVANRCCILLCKHEPQYLIMSVIHCKKHKQQVLLKKKHVYLCLANKATKLLPSGNYRKEQYKSTQSKDKFNNNNRGRLKHINYPISKLPNAICHLSCRYMCSANRSNINETFVLKIISRHDLYILKLQNLTDQLL